MLREALQVHYVTDKAVIYFGRIQGGVFFTQNTPLVTALVRYCITVDCYINATVCLLVFRWVF